MQASLLGNHTRVARARPSLNASPGGSGTLTLVTEAMERQTGNWKAATCIVVPAFNEGLVIERVLQPLVALGYTVVVVDDGSSDDTARRALKLPVFVLQNVCNLGQGAALQTGITYALRLPRVCFVVTFDADGQHEPRDIANLVRPLVEGRADVALGSRFLPGAQPEGLPWSRRLLLKVAVGVTRACTGLQVTDVHNGMRAFTAAAAGRVRITQNRMAHASEILAQVAALHLRYCEVPVTVRYTRYSRHKGQSAWASLDILWDMVKGKVE